MKNTYYEYKKFLKTVNFDEKKEKGRKCKIGILITPWLNTPVPWYGITIGLLLMNKGYSEITFIISDIWNRKLSYYNDQKKQLKKIIKVLKCRYLKKLQIDVLNLSQVKEAQIDAEDKAIISYYAKLNTIKYIGNSVSDKKHEYIYKEWKTVYYNMCGKIKGCAELEWDRLIIPGGMFQETGLFLEIFKNKKTDVITYDSGAGRYKVGIGVCAAQNGNVGSTANYILANEKNINKIADEARNILLNRMQMRPELSVVGKGKVIQNVAYQDEYEDGKYQVVIFTNLEFDTAALGTHDVFENDYVWIEKTVQFILENTKANIAIRQHPLQRQFEHIITNEENIKNLFKGNDRVTFIDYKAKVNSYNLVNNAKVVIVNTSTIGLEAGMLGKPVITESHCYYKDAGFVKYSDTEEGYYNSIKMSLTEEKGANEKEQLEAAVYYYLTQKCSSILTDFTPQPTDFELWSKKSFEELCEDRTISYMLNAIIDLQPIDRQMYNTIWNN